MASATPRGVRLHSRGAEWMRAHYARKRNYARKRALGWVHRIEALTIRRLKPARLLPSGRDLMRPRKPARLSSALLRK